MNKLGLYSKDMEYILELSGLKNRRVLRETRTGEWKTWEPRQPPYFIASKRPVITKNTWLFFVPVRREKNISNS